MSTLHHKTSAPFVYVRYEIPDEYVAKINEMCAQAIVEPWGYGKAEPEPSTDLSDCDVLITLGLQDTLGILKKAPNVKWIHSMSVGVDTLLNDDIRNSDIVVTNSKGCTSIPIAEHALAMMMALSRGVPEMVRNQTERKWGGVTVTELSKATVGIIGYGEIGFELAKRCKALDMRVVGCRRHPGKTKMVPEPADMIVGLEQVDEVISQSDFLVLCLPSTEETYHFMNKERLHKMKKGSVLVNVGRGNTIVEEALAESLENGQLAGAALDVFEVEPLPPSHVLWGLKNVIVSPHIAYFSSRNMERSMDLFLQNLELYKEGKPLLNVVDKKLGY